MLSVAAVALGASQTQAKSVASFKLCSDYLTAIDSGQVAKLSPYLEFMEGYFTGGAIATNNLQLMSYISSGEIAYRKIVAESCEQFPYDSFGHVVSIVFDMISKL